MFVDWAGLALVDLGVWGCIICFIIDNNSTAFVSYYVPQLLKVSSVFLAE
jgi:hypothetical protein